MSENSLALNKTVKTVQVKAYLTNKQITLFHEQTKALTYLWNLAVSLSHEEKQRVWREKGSKAALGFKGADKLDLSIAGNNTEMWVPKKAYPAFDELTEAEKLERRENKDCALACEIAYYDKNKRYIMAVPIRPLARIEKIDKKLYSQIVTNKWLCQAPVLPEYQVSEIIKVPSKMREAMMAQFDTAKKNYLAGHTRTLKFKSSLHAPIDFLATKDTANIKWYPEENKIAPFGSEFGLIKFRGLHNRHEGELPRSVTMTKKADGFYLSITFKLESDILPPSDKPVGIDPGVKVFLALSDQTKIDNNPASSIDKLTRRIALLQKKLSRQVLRSANWQDTKEQLARLHKKLADARKHYAHKVSSRIVDEYDEIYFEDTNLRNMTRKAKPKLNEDGTGYTRNNKAQKSGLNKAILSQGIGQVREMIKNKSEQKGRFFATVPAKDTSITCSKCGFKDKNNRPSQELFLCGSCGHTENADLNAAKIILKRGQKLCYNNNNSDKDCT